MTDYELCLRNSLFGVIHLIVEFMRKNVPPVKIVQVMPVAAAKNRSRFDCYSAGQAALWAFTRSLHRTFGNKMQVMEVILGKQKEICCVTGTTVEEVDDVNYENARQSCTVSSWRPSAAQILAQRIHELERQGREIVILPLKYKLSMYLGAIIPWRLG